MASPTSAARASGTTHDEWADLGLRPHERFLYEYDFTDGWQHDVRVERMLPLEPGRTYPVCVGGRRAVPPEDCGGPWAFLGLRQRYSLVTIARRLADLLEEGVIDDHREELLELRRWLVIDCFDRRAVNRQLAQVLGHPVGDLVAS
ncbi:plasmid pRiA4b ORF-3 family protein [Candidatus Dormiibacter inghamiae]|uniref:plasmid pRiA4b ORF-3 family protein n=1 Tax=Candidatus Dormiibacter inghamiae TaxID=3127013 RepID=UPI0030C74F0D